MDVVVTNGMHDIYIYIWQGHKEANPAAAIACPNSMDSLVLKKHSTRKVRSVRFTVLCADHGAAQLMKLRGDLNGFVQGKLAQGLKNTCRQG